MKIVPEALDNLERLLADVERGGLQSPAIASRARDQIRAGMAALIARVTEISNSHNDLADALAAEKLARERAEKDIERLREESHALLTITTTDGLSASEWMLRTAVAESKREAEARAEKAEAELREARHCSFSCDAERDALAADLKTAEERLCVAVLELKACRTYFELDGRTARVQRIKAALASVKGGE